MAETGVRVEALSAAGFVARELAVRPADTGTVLMHSVVWQYLPAAEQAAVTASVLAAGARATAAAPLAWLRFEPPVPDQGVELRCRLWPDDRDHLLARCHPHAARIDWVAA